VVDLDAWTSMLAQGLSHHSLRRALCPEGERGEHVYLYVYLHLSGPFRMAASRNITKRQTQILGGVRSTRESFRVQNGDES